MGGYKQIASEYLDLAYIQPHSPEFNESFETILSHEMKGSSADMA